MKNRSLTFTVATAMVVLYIVWGTTYLAIRWTVASIPPFLSAGTRFIIASGLLYLIGKLGSKGRFYKKDLLGCVVSGCLLAGLGNGLLVWAEQRVPSGTAALWVSILPIWILLLNWVWFTQQRPKLVALMGCVIGCLGIAMLPGTTLQGNNATTADILALLLSTLCWASGSLIQKNAKFMSSPFFISAVQMLSGGVLLMIFALLTHEPQRMSWESLTATSVGSLLYLIVAGTLVGFTTYSWLLQNYAPEKVATYTLVNPIVALFLGSWFGDQEISKSVLLSATIVLCGVGFIIFSKVPLKKELVL